MPQLEPDAISQKDLSDFLETADDFRFETDVFRICVEAGLTAQHGGTYLDPITGKDRQYDIRALWRVAVLDVKFAIECKNVRVNYPLLVSRIPRRESEAWHEVIMQSPTRAPSRNTLERGLFKVGEPVGKALANIGRIAEGKAKGQLDASNTEIYERWGQAVSSAAGMVHDWVHFLRTVPSHTSAAAFIPVVVVPDGSLWTVDYDATGAKVSEPTQAQWCTYYLGKTIPKSGTHAGEDHIEYMVSHLMIYTPSALRELLATLPSAEFPTRPCTFRDDLFPQSLFTQPPSRVPWR